MGEKEAQPGLCRGSHRQRMATSHLPTTANDGFRRHGLSADSGHAELSKQTAPFPLASEIAAGMTTSRTNSAARIAAARAALDLTLAMDHEPYSLPRVVFVEHSRHTRSCTATGLAANRRWVEQARAVLVVPT